MQWLFANLLVIRKHNEFVQAHCFCSKRKLYYNNVICYTGYQQVFAWMLTVYYGLLYHNVLVKMNHFFVLFENKVSCSSLPHLHPCRCYLTCINAQPPYILSCQPLHTVGLCAAHCMKPTHLFTLRPVNGLY